MEDATPLIDLEAAYIHYHQSEGHSRATWTRHESTYKLLHRFLSESGLPMDSRSLSTDAMRQFAIWLQETPTERSNRGDTVRSVYSIRGALKDMRALTRWLHDEGKLSEIPKIPVPRLPDTLFPILDDDRLEQVWESRYLTGRSALAIRNRALIGLLLDTGLRRGEIAKLTLANVDLEDCLLTVTGKGQKQRRVPFSTSVKQLLESWLAIRGTEEGTVFWLTAAGIRQVFRAIKDDVGLERFFPHMLRHQAATALVRNNVDLESVRRILGHSDISTTIKYLSMADEDLRAKHAAASPFDAMMKRAAKPEASSRKRRLSLKE